MRRVHTLLPGTYLNKARVLARFDYNVPLDDSGLVKDDFRIERTLNTINHIMSFKPLSLTIISHLGRPGGKYADKLSLRPIAQILQEKLCKPVSFNVPVPISSGISLLENLRFSHGEEDNDPDFARYLSRFGDIYINDSFSVLHRQHASVSAIYKYYNKDYNNILLGQGVRGEIEILDTMRLYPPTPFISILGGLKVSDKINTLKMLLNRADKILIGGAMSYCFLKAKGFNVGNSPCKPGDVILARELLDADIHSKIVLRIDHVASYNRNLGSFILDNENIPDGVEGFDIGPQTIKLFQSHLQSAKSVFWNGPLGFCEIDEYAKGTEEIAKTLRNISNNNDVYVVVGGGDSVSALRKLDNTYNTNNTYNTDNTYTDNTYNTNIHYLTGGGASLEYLANGTLPGIPEI